MSTFGAGLKKATAITVQTSLRSDIVILSEHWKKAVTRPMERRVQNTKTSFRSAENMGCECSGVQGIPSTIHMDSHHCTRSIKERVEDSGVQDWEGSRRSLLLALTQKGGGRLEA